MFKKRHLFAQVSRKEKKKYFRKERKKKISAHRFQGHGQHSFVHNTAFLKNEFIFVDKN